MPIKARLLLSRGKIGAADTLGEKVSAYIKSFCFSATYKSVLETAEEGGKASLSASRASLVLSDEEVMSYRLGTQRTILGRLICNNTELQTQR